MIIASVSIGYSLRSGSTSSGNNTNVTGYNSENDNNSKTQSNDKTADENAPELTISSTPTSISSSGEKLSAREREILRQVASGYTSCEIGKRLGISDQTVNTHIKNIYRKLQVRTRAQAVNLASLRGLLF